MYGLKFKINPIKKLYLIGVSMMPPFIKPALYKLIGFKTGKNIRIGWFSLIISDEFEIGDNSEISPFNLIICKKVSIGDNTIISIFNWIYGRASFKIGKHSFIGASCMINCYENIIIGNFTGIGAESALYTHGVWLSYTEGYPRRFKPIVIGNNVWIPVRTIILPVEIGNNAIIGTGSIIYKNIPENCFATTSELRISNKNQKEELSEKQKIKRIHQIVNDFATNTKYLIKSEGFNVWIKNSSFDFKARKCTIKDKAGKEFKHYVLTYWGEWFD